MAVTVADEQLEWWWKSGAASAFRTVKDPKHHIDDVIRKSDVRPEVLR